MGKMLSLLCENEKERKSREVRHHAKYLFGAFQPKHCRAEDYFFLNLIPANYVLAHFGGLENARAGWGYVGNLKKAYLPALR